MNDSRNEQRASQADPSRTGAVVRACNACRSMKMKCEGAQNPPCMRCRKAGRECIQQASLKENERRVSPSSVSDLPSIFSASPVETVGVQTQPLGIYPYAQKRRRTDETLPIVSCITRRDLKDLLLMFRERILPHISLFQPDLFQDLDNLIDTDHSLVICACYTAARYITNGKAVQNALLPEIISFIQGASFPSSLSLFRSLLILYLYTEREPPPSNAFELADQGQLRHWPLKYRIELCALQLSLHTSVQAFKAELRNSPSTMGSHNASFQKYFFWLNLFLTSHYYSIICGTPPSIRIDSGIRAAPALLRQLGWPQLNRTLGELEICLIWEQASLKLPQMGEWWCPPDISEVDDALIEQVILDTDQRLDAWHANWAEKIQAGEHYESILEYHCRFTRFYISSYAVRCLRTSCNGITPLQQACVRRCVILSHALLEWPLNMSPIQQDRLQYLAGSSSTMVAFCCLFLISTCRHFTSSVPNVHESIELVTNIARLMMRLAVDMEHKPYVHGSLIMRKVGELKRILDVRTPAPTLVASHDGPNLTDGSAGGQNTEVPQEWPAEFDFGVEGVFMAPFWEFPDLHDGSSFN